ncbi:MAG TPA: flagellar hook protein FlgE [Burkholderiales bacterium]|nr:flagellar hook protein FlgE [Burkholderiales bacterium]
MAFQQGLSGLNAASKGLDVIGNNIANSNTVGFKASQAQFADVYANSLLGGGNAVGIGTQVATVAQQFSQGNVTSSNNPLDVAINGSGFFRMSDNGAVTYTRNGQFQLDKDGFLVNSEGMDLTGYPVDSNGLIVPSSPTTLQIPTGDISPQSTSNLKATINLDSRLQQPVTGVFNPADPTSYNNSTSVTLFDTLGNPHLLSMFFVKTANPNEWDTYATVDGTAAANVDFGGGGGVATQLNFSTGGVLTTGMPLTATVDLAQVSTDLGVINGAASPLTFDLDFNGTSQFGSNFGVSSLSQNGYTSGRLSGLAIGQDGVIQGRYSNGQARNIGQIVLANFNNPQGLKPLGNNQWAESPDSGAAAVGAPDSGSLGVLQASAVEDSNVDLTAELVNMITMQRTYQANAQTIKTQDSLLQTLVNLR